LLGKRGHSQARVAAQAGDQLVIEFVHGSNLVKMPFNAVIITKRQRILRK
jgi:hypothetical protein